MDVRSAESARRTSGLGTTTSGRVHLWSAPVPAGRVAQLCGQGRRGARPALVCLASLAPHQHTAFSSRSIGTQQRRLVLAQAEPDGPKRRGDRSTGWTPDGNVKLQPGLRIPSNLAEARPEGKLLEYLAGLTEEDRLDVFSKLAAAGYAKPGYEDLVETLTGDNLKDMGIEPSALRSRLLQAFATAGPSKVVVLVDDQGNEEKLEFHHRLAFELWAATNTLTLSSKGGRRECIKTWERLQDGGRYYTSRTLEKTAADLEVVQRSFDKGLVGEVAEKALADMRHHHEEARRLFRGKGSALHNKRLGVKRQVDEIILADNCYKVLKVKQVVDQDAAEQLRSLMEFIKQGIADGEPDFSFAKRSNGTLREMKGALGGLRMVSGEQNEQELKRHIAKGKWDMYLVGGGRSGNGSSCHEMP